MRYSKLLKERLKAYNPGIIYQYIHFAKFLGPAQQDIGTATAKVKMPKVSETVVPTFTEKEIERLLAQPDKSSNEGFRDYCLLLTLIDTGIRLSELAYLDLPPKN